eukprot:4349287-Pyramimonas_sp.AAC.1
MPALPASDRSGVKEDTRDLCVRLVHHERMIEYTCASRVRLVRLENLRNRSLWFLKRSDSILPASTGGS